jgi:hypothetical protein
MISANSVSCAVPLNTVAMPSLLTPDLYQFKYLDRKIRQRFHHPASPKHKDKADDQQLRNKRDRLFMNLRRGLYDRNTYTNDHTDDQKRSCDLQNQYE